ncbi:MAG: DivIVA domain-containing protein, partial [Acidimicrobiales bacterium]
DPAEVRTFLEMVGREMETALERMTELREALADAEHRAANPEIDEATLTTALGKETARVLRSAHDAASEVISRAESDAQRTRQHALEEAEKVRTQAEQYAAGKRSQADAASADTLKQANEEAVAKLESARLEGESMVSQSKAECRMMLKEAQELRSRVLGDMSSRRSLLKEHISRLKEARSKMVDVVLRTKDGIEGIAEELLSAEGGLLDDPDTGHDDTPPGVESGLGTGKGMPEKSDETQERTEFAGEATQSYTATATDDADDDDDATDAAAATATAATATATGGNDGSAGIDSPMDGNGSQVDDEEQISELGSVVEGSRTQLVDEIFARLRTAKSAREVAPATAVIGGSAQPEVVPVVDESEGGPGEAGTEAGTVAGTAAETEQATEEQAEGGPGEAGTVAGAEQATEEQDDLRHDLFALRDDVLNDLVDGLSRKLKRALQDYQNELLNRIHTEKEWSDAMLPSAGDRLDNMTLLCIPGVESAARQGMLSVLRVHSDADNAGDASEDAVTARKLMESASADMRALAGEISSAILNALSKRIEDGGIDLATADMDALVDHVGAAYREGKGARIEQAVEDQMVAAFSLGQVLMGNEMEVPLRWVSARSDRGCPDCEDNALSDPLGNGQEFPTGHLHPPVHAGCRCLLEPVISLQDVGA